MKNAKNKDFYQKVIERSNEIISDYESQILNFPKPHLWGFGDLYRSKEIYLQQIKLVTFSARLNNLIASYSKGATKSELKQQFSEALMVMEKVWDKKITKVYYGVRQKELDQYKLSPYLYMLQMFALSILLDASDDEFNVLVNLIDRDKVKDYLIEFFIIYRVKNREKPQNESYSRFVIIPQLYKDLVDVAYGNSIDSDEEAIKHFLDKKWIKIPKKNSVNLNLKDIPNYEVKDGFVGLWAFEVAALVKIKGLDDSSFRDNQFYPDRLV